MSTDWLSVIINVVSEYIWIHIHKWITFAPFSFYNSDYTKFKMCHRVLEKIKSRCFFFYFSYIQYNYFLLLLVTLWQRNTCTLPHTRTHTQCRASQKPLPPTHSLSLPLPLLFSLSSYVELWDMIRTIAECKERSEQKDRTNKKVIIFIYLSIMFLFIFLILNKN